MSAETLLQLIARHISSVREGADAVVVHYAWRRAGGDDASFASGIGELHGSQCLEIISDSQSYLRLTGLGYEQLPPAANDEDDAADEEPPRRPARLSPVQMEALVIDIFQLAARAGDTGLTATALAAIWKIECQRAADLRGVLDSMLSNRSLRVERGQRTVFFRN